MNHLLFLLATLLLQLTQLFSEQKPIAVIVPAHNNSTWCTTNLNSLLTQRYNNFRVIYVDDGSTDRTADLVQHYLSQCDSKNQVALIQNSNRTGTLSCIAQAAKGISYGEIIVVVHGNDLLAPDALNKINQIYSNPDVWMTYGKSIEHLTGSVKDPKEIPHSTIANNEFRQYDKADLAFCTFYAWLFHNINAQDLALQDAFPAEPNYLAAVFPMLEMSGFHSRFIQEALYIRNPISPEEQQKMSRKNTQLLKKKIRSQLRHKPLIDHYSSIDGDGKPLDQKLLALLSNENGVFIEAGALDGIRQSNTKLLEERLNWTGILIEPSPSLYEALCSNRPKSRCFSCALGSLEEEGTTATGDFDGHPMSSIQGAKRGSTPTVTVPVRCLQSLLDECGIDHVHFFSLDTEGYELKILQGIDFSRTTFDYLLIEICQDYQEIVSFLDANGYEVHSNFSNYRLETNPSWDQTHNDYLFHRKPL